MAARCPTVKCLESRPTAEGFRRRRYRNDAGVRFTTIEVPIEVWNSVKRPEVVASRMVGRQREIARQALKLQALILIRRGEKPESIANELGLTARTIQRWRVAP